MKRYYTLAALSANCKEVYPAKIKDQSRAIPALTNHQMLSVSWKFSEDTPASEIMGDSG